MRPKNPMSTSRGIALFAVAVCVALPAAAQMPSPKAMEDAMRQMQRALGQLTPDQRKMLEQAQRQAQQPAPGAEDDEIGVPARDAARIAQVQRQPLTGAALKAYVASLQPKLRQTLSRDALRRAESVEDVQRKAGGDLTVRLRQAANGLAAWGAWPEATYLMGKVALASGSAQDLNNLAAFLTMLKAAQAALPILITLDARHPGNSTIQNNLGQAWFELGDVKEAERVLRLAVRRAPQHPQANVTLSRIDEARGDKAAAQAAMHAALRGGYSEAKEQRLRKLGGRLAAEDVRGKLKGPTHPLRLSDLAPPPYPGSAAETLGARVLWQAYHRQLLGTIAKREAEAGRAAVQRADQALAGVRPGRRLPVTREAVTLLSVHAPLAPLAQRVMRADDEAGRPEARRVAQALDDAERLEETERARLTQTVQAIRAEGMRRYANVPGGYPPETSCKEVLAAQDAYLAKVSTPLERAAQGYAGFYHRRLGDTANLLQYTLSDAEFAATASALQAQFLHAVERAHGRITMDGVHHAGFYGNGIGEYADICLRRPASPTARHELADFDAVNCQSLVSFAVPGIGHYEIRCNAANVVLDPLGLPLKAQWSEDLVKDRVLAASVEVGQEISELVDVSVGAHGEFDDDGLKSGGVRVGAEVDVMKSAGAVVKPGGDTGKLGSAGPPELGLGARGGIGVEFDRSGITDVRIDSGVGAKASSTVGKTDAASPGVKATTDVAGTWSWNAGTSATVSGGFDRKVF